MAGVDGIKPPSADLESAVLLTELNSLKDGQDRIRTCEAHMPELQKLRLKPLGHPTITKVPVNRQELHLRGKYSAYLRLRDTGTLIIAFILSGVKNFYRSLLDADLTRSVGRRR